MPHLPQNELPSGTFSPHFGQILSIGAGFPHAPQNLLPEGIALPQKPQNIAFSGVRFKLKEIFFFGWSLMLTEDMKNTIIAKIISIISGAAIEGDEEMLDD